MNIVRTAILLVATYVFSVTSVFNVQAVEPVTAAAAAKPAIDAITNLLQKDTGNPPLAVAQANRDLIIALHSRLDNIESSVATILEQLSTIPEEILKQSINAQEYGLGKRIAAIGNAYYNTYISTIEDINSTTTSEHQIDKYNEYLKRNMEFYIGELVIAANDILLRPQSVNTLSLTVVSASYIELSLKIHQYRQFFGIRSDIENTAKKYVAHFDLILDPKNEFSLVSLENEYREILREKTKEILGEYEYLNLENLNAGLLLGRFKIGCYTQEYWKQTRDLGTMNQIAQRHNLRWRAVPQGQYYAMRPEERGNSVLLHQLVWIEPDSSKDLIVKFSKLDTIGDQPVISAEIVDTVFAAPKEGCELIYPAHNPLPTAEHILCRCLHFTIARWTPGLRREIDIIRELQPKLDSITLFANGLSQLTAVRKAVEKAREKAQDVANGNLDVISVVDFLELDTLNPTNILLYVANVRSSQSLERATQLSDRMADSRKQVAQLIANQDTHLQAVFNEAAKAAKFNRMLSYIRGAAALTKLYFEHAESWTPQEKNNMTVAMNMAISGIQSSPSGRHPSSEQLVKSLNNVLGQLQWWGGLYNAKIQLERMDKRRIELALELGPGNSAKYDIYAVGTEFNNFYRSDDEQIRPGGATYLGSETIHGK